MSKNKEGNWFSRHKLLTGIIIFILLVAIGGASGGGSEQKRADQAGNQTEATVNKDKGPAETTKQETKEKKERLTLDEGWQLDKSNPYMSKVVGYVTNNSDKTISGYIQVTFSALNAEGANVGDCLANANTVDANGKWKFEAMCTGNDIETVRFKNITGF